MIVPVPLYQQPFGAIEQGHFIHLFVFEDDVRVRVLWNPHTVAAFGHPQADILADVACFHVGDPLHAVVPPRQAHDEVHVELVVRLLQEGRKDIEGRKEGRTLKEGRIPKKGRTLKEGRKDIEGRKEGY